MRRLPILIANLVLLSISKLRAADAADVDPKLAVVPAGRFVITDYGAVGDGKTNNTEALHKATAACSRAGGGTVVVPAGTFVTGPFELASNMALELEADATIRGSDDFDDYRQPGTQGKDTIETELKPIMRPLISATDATNVAIVGKGTIDGVGQPWWVRTRAEKAAGAPAQGQKSSGAKSQSPRPRLVMFADCGFVHVAGVTLKDAPNFNVMPYRCHDVIVEDVTITAPADSPNTDGIDPANSRDVVIRRCNISVGDDHVSFKSSPGQPALENVRVTDCTFGHGHGTSIGSNVGGGVRNVTVEHCSFKGADTAIRIKSARDRGGPVENIVFRDITMDDVGTAILVNMFYFDKAAQKEREAKPVTRTTPVVRNVRIENVTITGAKSAGEIIGLPEMPVSDLVLDRVRVDSGTGLTLRDVTGLELHEVEIKPGKGEPLMMSHTEIAQTKRSR